MEDWPRVSIGVPVYNGAAFLEEALNSLCSQSFRSLEIIVCDNASTDGTEEIGRAFATRDGRVRYVRNERNLGATRNYNRAWELSRGEFFKWAAHDDVCAPTLVESCVAALDSRPEAVLAYPRTVIIDGEGRRVRDYDDALDLSSSRPSDRFRDYLFRSAQECNAIFGLLRASALKRTGRIGNFNASDRVLLAHLALIGEFAEVPQELFFRRDHAGTSLRANTTPGAVAAWFDPARRSHLVFPTWRLFREFFRVVAATPMNPAERTQCLLHLARGVWHKRERLALELGALTCGSERSRALPAGGASQEG